MCVGVDPVKVLRKDALFSDSLVALAHTFLVFGAVFLVVVCFSVSTVVVVTAAPPFFLCSNDRWKLIWISHGDHFQEAYVQEWDEEAHVSDSLVQESDYRWRDPSSWSWDAHG